MDKIYKTIKIGAAEYRELRAYTDRKGLLIQHALTTAIREFLARQNGQPAQPKTGDAA